MVIKLFKSLHLYGNSLSNELKENNKSHCFELNNETGNGRIVVYSVFEGIEFIFNDIHMEYCKKSQQQISDVLEINYCKEGRCECTFSKQEYCYMSAGDLAMYMLDNGNHQSIFPTAHYHGATITINFNLISEETKKLLKLFSINLEKIKTIMCDTSLFMFRTNERLQHIFEEIYMIKNEMQENYLRIKVLELLIFISDLKVEMNGNRENTYFSGGQVAKTKQVHDLIVKDISKHYTIDELSDRFQISATALKATFHGIYGEPIYTYLKDYRLQLGEKFLREKNFSIAEVAGKVGYQNPNKFTSAFRKAYGVTPTEFQKNV